MRRYDYREIKHINKVVVEAKCDICGKIINEKDYRYEVTIGHHDWGNDSGDSIEERDICSDECLKKELKLYLLEESTTKYIRIDKKV